MLLAVSPMKVLIEVKNAVWEIRQGCEMCPSERKENLTLILRMPVLNRKQLKMIEAYDLGLVPLGRYDDTVRNNPDSPRQNRRHPWFQTNKSLQSPFDQLGNLRSAPTSLLISARSK